jgi:hypothetical protein
MKTHVSAWHERDMARIRAEIARTDPTDVQRRVLLICAHERARRRAEQRDDVARANGQSSVSAPTASDRRRHSVEYVALVQRVCATASDVLPAGARLLVVSRGDDALLAVPSVEAAHFPQARGEWAGYYPENGADALAHLDALEGDGYEYILFPASSFWWLDYYQGLAARLLTKGRVLWHDESCAIFALQMANAERRA